MKEANVTDIINACVQLDKSDCLLHIVISAKSLNCIPRSHPEELNNITLLDRLNRLEGRMLNMQTTLDGIVAENMVLKEHIANSTTYASKISSTKAHQDKPSTLSMKVGDPSLSQLTDVKQIKDGQQPDVRPKIRTYHASSAQNIPEGISIPHLNQCPTVLSTDNACSYAQRKHSEDIPDDFRLPTEHLKQMRRRERRQGLARETLQQDSKVPLNQDGICLFFVWTQKLQMIISKLIYNLIIYLCLGLIKCPMKTQSINLLK